MTEDYMQDEIRNALVQLEDIMAEINSKEKLAVFKTVLAQELKSVDSYFIQIENEIESILDA